MIFDLWNLSCSDGSSQAIQFLYLFEVCRENKKDCDRRRERSLDFIIL